MNHVPAMTYDVLKLTLGQQYSWQFWMGGSDEQKEAADGSAS
jgi:hypothetical protein